MFSYDRGYLVHPYLACLFHEPLVPVVVLGGTYRHMQPVGMRAPAVRALQHDGLDTFVTVRRYAAPVQGPASVNDVDLIPASVPEHLDAVA